MHYTSVLNSNGVQGWDLFRSKYEFKSIINTERVYDKNDRFGKNRYEHFDGTITNQFANSQNAGYIYILMKWRPKNPIHPEAVYTSHSFSYKSLQDETDILS
ncbi:unnamed protein product [Rhizophagus irregularis]|nr:unnamed protein product [Rhizophagus irregularis]